MQPMTADDRPNILADIKRDHAHIFGLHRCAHAPCKWPGVVESLHALVHCTTD